MQLYRLPEEPDLFDRIVDYGFSRPQLFEPDGQPDASTPLAATRCPQRRALPLPRLPRLVPSVAGLPVLAGRLPGLRR